MKAGGFAPHVSKNLRVAFGGRSERGGSSSATGTPYVEAYIKYMYIRIFSNQ